MSANDLLAHSPSGAGFEAVLANVSFRGVGALLPERSALARFARAVVRNPRPAAGRLIDLSARLAHVSIGVAEAPGDLDRRFTDRAWAGNPLLKRIGLSYLAASATAMAVLDDTDVDWRTRERLRAPVDNLLAAVAPTNNPFLNPAGVKEFIDTGGGNVIRGVYNFVADMRTPAKLPASVDRSSFQLGENVATAKGKVVRRTRTYELIEYAPRTETVDAVPVVMVPSPVNKYYLLDLGPDESVVKAHLDRGRRLFVLSWVNPGVSHADVGFDDYVAGVVEAMETAAEVTESPSVHLLGLCGGGGVVFLTAAYLAATGRQELLASLTLGIAVIDYDRGPAMMAFMDRASVDKAISAATRTGFFDAAASARAFALARPVEGIWTNAVNNYLLGRRPPAISLLFWASDQTNLSARFGADQMYAALDNQLTKPGGVTVLGVPLDPRNITVDTYVLGASTDHISPWTDCYRTVALVGGSVSFVLAKGGHAIVVARGPGYTRTSYRTGELAATAEEWLTGSEEHPGSWWDHWTDWIEKQTPEKRPAPTSQGSAMYPPVADAPGEYVLRVLA